MSKYETRTKIKSAITRKEKLSISEDKLVIADAEKEITQDAERSTKSRRSFLLNTGLAAAATGALAAPAVVRAQTKYKWRLQSANPAGTPNIDLLNELAKKIQVMSDGQMELEILPSGAIVPPFEILDAVSAGIIEAGQWWPDYPVGKHPAGSLFGAPLGGSATGLDQMSHIAWYMRGGGKELLNTYYQDKLGADVVAFLYGPDGPEALGWFHKPVESVEDMFDLRFRISSGLASDTWERMGGIPVNMAGAELIPAAQKGILDGIEWINPANDIKVGLYDVFKYYSLQGLHQAIGIADIFFNGPKWRTLDASLQAIIESAINSSMLEILMFFIEANAQALKELQEEYGVTVFDAPDDYAPAFQAAAREILSEYEEKDEFFKEVLDSQRDFAKKVIPYYQENLKTSILITGALEHADK